MDSTHRWTKAQLAEMEDHLSRIYAEANGDIEKKLFDHLEKFKKMDEQKRKEVEKAQKQGAENAEELFEEWKRWRRTQMFQGQNWRNKLSELTRQYLEVNKTALAYVNGEMPRIAARNYNAFEDEANEAAAKYGLNEYSFNLVDEHTVKKLATENETLLPYKIVDGKKDVRWNTDKINAQMLQGILQGEDIPTIASRLQNVTEMNRESAVRNARTMTTSAECAGRQMSYTEAEKDGMIIEREWLCTADSRRRDWHWELNGTFTKVNEPWRNDYGEIMYPGDPNAKPQNVYNCRCSIAAKVVGFEESMKKTKKKANSITKKSASIEEAIKKANELGVKYAQFQKMPLEQVNNVIDAINTLPKDCVPKVVANGKDVSVVTDRPLGRKAESWYGVTYDYRLFGLHTMQLGYESSDHEGGQIVGLNTQKFKTLEALTKAKEATQEKYFAKTGHYWNFNTDGRATAYHEIGHCFVNVRGLPEGWEEISERWAEESKCDLLKKPEEAFAEAWAAYHLKDKRLPDYISNIIGGLK